MIVKSTYKNYKVYINNDFAFFYEYKKDIKNTFFIIDENIYKLYYDKLFKDLKKEKVYILEAIEENKTVLKALEICEIMTKLTAKRNIHLISLGGGITQDITGFIANILYRGIKWTFVPTTLLAACDSCIGGKTSLNHKEFKNLLGTFYPPDQIYICPLFFETLTEKDFKSGLGEVVKFNVMCGREGIEYIKNKIDKLLSMEYQTINEFILRSLMFKKTFIEEDEFDRGIRIHLNFAHTFGHAIETVTNYKVPHGIAVTLGMIIANRISLKRKLLSKEDVKNIEMLIKKINLSKYTQYSFQLDSFVEAIKKDKKQIDSNITGVLLYDDMKLKIVNNISIHEIKEALLYLESYLLA